MKLRRYLYRLVFVLPVLFIVACSGGAAEKPPLDSLTSPAKLLDQGIYHYHNNNYPKAIHNFDKALLQYRSIDNQTGIANSCMNLAKTYMAINNNQTAADYLARANSVVERARLTQLEQHLHLLNSSLAIKNTRYDRALEELKPVLNSRNTTIKLAALKNRSRIAFIKNHSDKQQWLERYKTLQKSNPKNTSSHLARILRFEAQATDDADRKTELLAQSLSLSQQLANRTAIAATLSQWAATDLKNKRYQQAEDKSLRALFIRHQLSDVKNSLAVLKQLQSIYIATGDEKENIAKSWIAKLSGNELENWDNLFADFETYPQIK